MKPPRVQVDDLIEKTKWRHKEQLESGTMDWVQSGNKKPPRVDKHEAEETPTVEIGLPTDHPTVSTEKEVDNQGEDMENMQMDTDAVKETHRQINQGATDEEGTKELRRDEKAKVMKSTKETRRENREKRWRKYVIRRLRVEGKS